MFEFINLIKKSSKTIQSDFDHWFKDIPVASTWILASDYCVGDKNKKSDAFSFVIIPQHDTDQNIASYISTVAPKDIKSTRTPSEGLLDYLSCPVTFSYNFVVERESHYLRNATTVSVMKSLTEAMIATVHDWQSAEPANAKYYSDFDRKLNAMLEELSGKNPSSALFRRIFLVSSFAAIALSLINEKKAPLNIRWISDRDAMFDRHDGIAFDITWLLFQTMRRIKGGYIDVRRPQLIFATPYMDGFTDYAEFVRMPDLLAGTLADMRIPNIMFSHRKFPPVFNRLFLNSLNNAIVEIVASPGNITSRRIAFGEPPKGFTTTRPYKNNPIT